MTPSSGHGRQAHVPALDGLRGFAIAAVLCFHQPFGWARGGFLGVSTFFTLSGFLIGRITFGELRREGRLRVDRFWSRRARRLVPAAAITVLATAVVCRFVDLGQPDRLRGDLLAALGWVANWRMLSAGSGYQAAFNAPSPVQHFWSLAIEEQFYLLFPLVAVVVVGLLRKRFVLVAAAFAALAAGGFALAAVVAERSSATAYYGTHTRAAEIFTGVAFAAVWTTPGFTRVLAARRRWVAGLGAPALAVLVLLAATTSVGSPALFRGITALNALATLAVLTACLVPGPVAAVLGNRLLVLAGRFSYGAYLYHWLVFLVLAPPRVHLGPGALFGLRLAVTAALATVSGLVLEEPIRFGRVHQPRRVAALTAGALAVVAGLVLLPAVHPPPRSSDRVALPSNPVVRRTALVVPTPFSEAAARPASATLQILLAGDSTAYSTITGFTTWNEHHPEHPVAIDATIDFGCPVHGHTPIRLLKQVLPLRQTCIDLPAGLAHDVSVGQPDVVVFLAGFADAGDVQMDGRWRHLGDSRVDDLVRNRLGQMVDAAGNRPVFLVVPPAVDPRDQPPTIPGPPYVEAEPARMAQLQDLVREVAAARADRVTLIDLALWCEARSDRCLSPDFRPDGVHYSRRGADAVAAFLASAVTAARPR